MLSSISQVNTNKIELPPSFNGGNNKDTRQPVERQNSKSWMLWTGLAALGAVGIYLATRGKGGVKTVEKAAPKTPSNEKNAGKVPSQTPNKVPDKASADSIVSAAKEFTGDDAINKLNEAYKAGKILMYAYIPKNRKDCVVVIEVRNSNGAHYLYSRVFDRKTFKYNVSLNNIVEDIKPISSKNFSRNLFNKKLGSAKIMSENGAEISINNNMSSGCSGVKKELNIIKDGLSYKKSKYIREKDNAKICTEDLSVQDYAGFKVSVNGTVENVSDNFDIHKKEFFEKLRKKQ